jgi:hypothetical protein
VTERDLGELLHSPLDDEVPAHRWAVPVAGLAGAVVVFILLSAVIGGRSQPGVPTTTTAEPAIVEIEDPFPPGFTAISDDLAIKAYLPLDVGERLLVPIALSARRGVAPDETAPPLGGVWEMETATGPLQSTGVVADPLRPGAMSIVFPAGTAPTGGSLRLVELWEARAVDVESSIVFPGVPFSVPEAIVHDLGDGVTLTIGRVELRNLVAEAEWAVSGTDYAVTTIGLELLLEDGSLLEEYSPTLIDAQPATSGSIPFIWPFGIRVDQDEASTLVVRAEVTVGTPVEIDLAIPLPSG